MRLLVVTRAIESGGLDALFGGPPSNPTASETNVAAAPQIRLDAEGNIVLDEATLDVKQKNSGASFGMATANAVRFTGGYKVTKACRWTKEETDKFYDTLQQYGEDLFLIQTVFRDKTSTQLKSKLKMELKKNPDRFNAALDHKLIITTESFQKDYGAIGDESTVWQPVCNTNEMLALEDSSKSLEDASTQGSSTQDSSTQQSTPPQIPQIKREAKKGIQSH